MLALAFLAGEFGRRHYWLDQLSQFRGQIGLAALGGLAVALLLRRWRPGGAFIVLVFVGIWLTFPGVPAGSDAGPGTIRLMSFNAFTKNERPEDVVTLIQREQPDLVLLFEVSEQLDAALVELEREYAYHQRRLFSRGGSIILSKLPLLEHDLGYAGFSSQSARVRLPSGRPLNVFAVHLLSPLGERQWRWRNDGLKVLAASVRNAEGPTVVAGDFNTTPYSVFFRTFLEETGLRPPGVHGLPRATWFSSVPWVGLPIDHVLLSPEITVERAWTGPSAGSDHFAVFAELRVP